MPIKQSPYSAALQEYMQLFAATLNERDLRRYAAVEALKFGHGGINYIAKLLKIDPDTVSKGISELQKKI